MSGHGSNESQMSFGAGEDPALAELLAAIDGASGGMDTAAVSVDERTALLQAAGSFGGEMGDEYVGGEAAALAVDSETVGDAARTTGGDGVQGVAMHFRFLGMDPSGFMRLGIVREGDE